MTNLSTRYLGLELENPILAGASGLTSNMKMIEKLQESGVGAIVCKSLFEEEIQLESLKFQKDIHRYDHINAEMLTTFPDLEHGGPKNHLYWLKRTKESITVPVIASLNAINEEIWLDYSRRIEDTGVDAIELNLYRIPDQENKGSKEIEEWQTNLLRKIKEQLSIPVSVKLSPYYTHLTEFIQNLDNTGVDGVVLFNRLFAPDIDIHKEEHIFPFSFSHKTDNLLTQKFTGLLYGTLKGDICSSQGIIDGEDLIKMLLAGADAVQVVTTLYQNAPSRVGDMKKRLTSWMEEKSYSSIVDFQGRLSRKSLKGRKNWIYQRSQYVKMLMQSSESLTDQIF